MTRTLRGINTAYSTNFPSPSANPLSESGVWRTGLTHGSIWTDIRTNPNRAYGLQNGSTASIYNDSIGHVDGGFVCNQTITGIVFNSAQTGLASNQEVELFARQRIEIGDARGYEFTYEVTGKYAGLVLWMGPFGQFNEFTHVTNVPVLVSGDELKLVCSGNVFSGYRNGSLIASGTDSSLAAGMPGMGAFLHNITDTGSINNYGFTNWNCQSFTERTAASSRVLSAARTIVP